MSAKKTARLAGFFYLIIAICGGSAEIYVRQFRMIVPNNAAETASNILASERLFRIAFMSDIIMMVSYLLLGLTLYALLKDVHRNAAVLMLVFNLIGVPIMCLNMLNHFAALHVLNADYMTVFSVEQLNAFSLFFLELHYYGYIIAQVSTGTWLLPLGYLVYKSDYFPKLLGILLMIASVGYLVDLFAQFLLPKYANTIELIALTPAPIGELSFLLWLLIKGVRQTKQP